MIAFGAITASRASLLLFIAVLIIYSFLMGWCKYKHKNGYDVHELKSSLRLATPLMLVLSIYLLGVKGAIASALLVLAVAEVLGRVPPPDEG